MIGAFLAAHPAAKRFVETSKPIPTNFAREVFFAVTSFKFINADGVVRHGRFRIRPAEGTEHLAVGQAAAKSPEFLFEELGPRLAKASLRPGVLVQMASDDDDVTDSSVVWPDNRPEIAFGTITLTGQVDDREPERPLSEVRSEIYLLSGRRRRAAHTQ